MGFVSGERCVPGSHRTIGCVLTWQREMDTKLSDVSFYWVLILSWGSHLTTSSNPSYLPKTPSPNITPVGIRVVMHEFWEDMIQLRARLRPPWSFIHSLHVLAFSSASPSIHVEMASFASGRREPGLSMPGAVSTRRLPCETRPRIHTGLPSCSLVAPLCVHPTLGHGHSGPPRPLCPQSQGVTNVMEAPRSARAADGSHPGTHPGPWPCTVSEGVHT